MNFKSINSGVICIKSSEQFFIGMRLIIKGITKDSVFLIGIKEYYMSLEKFNEYFILEEDFKAYLRDKKIEDILNT